VVEPSASNEAGESKADGVSVEDALMELAEGARFFRSAEGDFHAQVRVGECDEIISLRSNVFRDWLVDGYRRVFRVLPSRLSVNRVIGALEARARFEVEKPTVHVRIGHGRDTREPCYYLDLGDPSGRAVEISTLGWSLVDRPAVHFRRPEGMLALPVPRHDGSIELLRPFVNVSDQEFRLLVAWMAAALRPIGPYPVLAIHGEQGSAKSTLARIIRKLIDPQTAPLLCEPSSTRDLLISAVNGWLLAFDNVSALPQWLSDSLCRLATGGGFATRALYTNNARSTIYAQCPVILNGIDSFVRKGDLADRSVFLYLPPILATGRRAEEEFWARFDEQYPLILGGLLDAVAMALCELPSVKLDELPRMADFARFGEAIGRGLGWQAGTFIKAYEENCRETTVAALDDSPLAIELLKMASWGMESRWTKSPTDMLRFLEDGVSRKTLGSKNWPKTPTQFGNEVRRIAPHLRAHGIDFTFGKTVKGRHITLTLSGRSGFAGGMTEDSLPA
jgi:hypothetical protein